MTMKHTRLTINETELAERLLPLLEGRAFHVSELSNLPAILTAGAIHRTLRAHLQRRSGTRNTRTFVTAAAYPSSTCALHLQMRTFSGDAHRSVRLGILRGWRFSSCRRLLARISCRGPGGRSSKPGEK